MAMMNNINTVQKCSECSKEEFCVMSHTEQALLCYDYNAKPEIKEKHLKWQGKEKKIFLNGTNKKYSYHTRINGGGVKNLEYKLKRKLRLQNRKLNKND
jgi:hypothetical protein